MRRWRNAYLFLALLTSLPRSMAQVIFTDVNFGLTNYTSDRFQTDDVISVGLNYGLAVGLKYYFVSLEAMYDQTSNQGPVDHNYEQLRLHVRSTHYGLLSRFYLADAFYIGFGHAWHSTNQYLERISTGETVTDGDGPEIYDAGGERQTSGFFYGVGVKAPITLPWEWFFDALFYSMYEGESTLKKFNLGIRYSF